MLFKLICIFLMTTCAYGSVSYKIIQQYPGATHSEFDITGESGEWTLELKYDDKVKMNVSNKQS